jgi:putative hydrolase of the HAD superfamily
LEASWRAAVVVEENSAVAIEAVIFDIGGVLEVTPETGWPERWAGRLGLARDDFDGRLAPIWPAGAVGDATLPEIEAQIARTFHLDDQQLAELMDDIWAEYVGTLNVELLAYFERLRPRFKTGIMSNSFVGAREREHALYQFADRCDAIVYSHEVGFMKPDTRIYGLICEQLEVAPPAAVLVDDADENIEGATAVGMRGIPYRNNAQAITELEALLGAI